MSKKSFKSDIATGADRFFSVYDAPEVVEDTADTADTQNTGAIQDIKRTRNTARKAPAAPAKAPPAPAADDTADGTTYRLNLKLRGEYKDFLADEAWRQRTSITELLNRLIGEYRDKVQGG
ncbi:hypothetical protein LJC74_07565 [Eubacteriales bacterium OttesenSCG-928-A19]|nr:hypothetical protein [Eubacteriales bacterium OttesenSCG-928-A19]